jgi:hypothetical protein
MADIYNLRQFTMIRITYLFLPQGQFLDLLQRDSPRATAIGYPLRYIASTRIDPIRVASCSVSLDIAAASFWLIKSSRTANSSNHQRSFIG